MAVVAGLKKSLNIKKYAGYAAGGVGIRIYMRKKKSPAKGVLEKGLSFIRSERAVSAVDVAVGGL